MADDPSGEEVSKTAISALGPSAGDVFGHRFDLGDDGWHAIAWMAIKAKTGD